MKLIYIAFVLHLIFPVRNQCSTGCLQCTSENQCILCDPLKGFVLVENSCVQNIVENCEEYDYNSKCKLCADEYYLSIKDNSCTQIQSWQVIENCRKYQGSDFCLYCKEGFYQIKGLCIPVKITIENCEIYQQEDTCLKCKENYSVLQPDRKTCKVNSVIDNCQAYSAVSCQECPENKISFQNFQIENFLENLKIKDYVYEQHSILMYQDNSLFIRENCFIPKIQNCSQYQDIYSCFVCNKGYYMNQGLCYKQPEAQIQFCELYKNSQICIKCKQGYFLKSNSLCLPVEGIQNCQQYDGSAETEQCIKCSEIYFVQNNQCVKRSKFVDFCDEYYSFGDYCQQCQQYYQLTDDNLKCLPEIYNCKTYQQSSIYQDYLYCYYCEDGHYFDKINRLCVKGSISFCRVYKPISEECEICHNKYYLKDNKCIRHDEIENCDIYDNEVKNLCKDCNFDTWKFSKETQCLPAYIEGCLNYSSTTTCEKCKDWYDFQDNKNCVKIPEKLHCKRSVFNLCKECQEGYILQNDACRLPHSYIIQNCMQYTTNGTISVDDDIECQKCAYTTTPLIYQESYFCIRQEHIKNQIKNCKNYSINNGDFVCDFCQDGFYLNEGECLPQCPPSKTIQRIKVQFNGQFILYKNKDVCVDSSFDHCLVEGFKVSSEFDIDEACSIYTESIYKFLDFSQDSRIVHSIDIQKNNQNQKFFKLPTYELKSSITTDNLMGLKDQEKIPNCYAYSEIGFIDKIGCAQCKHGYYGKVKNWKIDHCFVYTDFDKADVASDYQDNLTCQQCLDYYYLDEDGLRCLEIPVIKGCEKYYTYKNKCESCMEGYYLKKDSSLCLKNTVANCMFKSFTENECLKCNHDYMLNSDSTQCVKKIPFCDQQSSEFPYKCQICEHFHYPSQTSETEQNACIHGTVSHCWLYDQTQIDKCKKYQNVVQYYQKNTCEQNLNLSHCKVYKSHSQCQVCDREVSFLIENESKCCLYGQYFDDSCKNSTVQNCKESQYTTANKCSKCKENYELFTDNDTDYCCQSGYYLKDQTCVQEMNFDNNSTNCAVFDIENMTCTSCKSGYYQSSKYALCCAEGKYDLEKQCTDITMENCLQYNSDDSVCKKCSASKEIDSTTIKVINSNYCCLETQYLDGTTCTDIPTSLNCTEVEKDGSDWKCTDSCKTDYYYDKDNKVCCLSNSSTVQYFDGIECKATTAIDKCIEYNDDQKCEECKDSFYLTNDKSKCCDINSFYDGNNCTKMNINFENCAQFSSSSCTKCKNGYYLASGACIEQGKYLSGETLTSLTDISFLNCLEPSSDQSKCIKCKDDHYLMQKDQKKCCEFAQVLIDDVCTNISDKLENCAITKLSDYSCQVCAYNGTDYFYKSNTTDKCCKFGQYYSSSDCVDIDASENCLAKNASACTKCKSGYYLNSSSACAQLPNQCLSVDSSYDCELCEKGYTLKTDKSCATLSSLTNIATCPVDLEELNNNCISLDQTETECKCLKCRENFYGDFCCRHGYYFNLTKQKCVQISNENCAEYNDTDGECTKCFVNTELKISQNYRYKFQSVFPQFFDLTTINSEYTDFVIDRTASQNYLGSDTNQCCPNGQFWQNSKCIEIPIKNCLKYESDTCTQCEDNYTYNLTYKLCCRFNETVNTSSAKCEVDSSYTDTCPGTQYVSNGYCCDLKKYWDVKFKKCLPILDQDCNESNDGIDCSQCAGGYSQEFEFYAKLQMTTKSVYGEQFYDYIKYTKLCSNFTNATYKATVNIVKSFKHCAVYDQDKGECKTAIKDYTANKISCPKDYQHHVTTGYHMCKLQSAIDKNCAIFSNATDCKQCKTGYHFSNNRCCPLNTYYNELSDNCGLHIENCKKLDNFNFGCIQCEDGFYFSQGHCCKLGQFYNSTYQKCEQIKGRGLFSCTKSQNNIDCQECSGDDLYLSNQKCCFYGTYWHQKQCVQNRKTLHCKIYDNNGSCIECKDSKQLLDQTCCDEGQILAFNGLCLDGPVAQCTKYNADQKCIACNNSFYLSDQICCSDEQYSVSNECTDVSEQPNWGCSKLNDSGTCIDCNSVTHLKSNVCCVYGQFYDTISCTPINQDPDCLQLDSSGTECVLCDNDKMVLNNACITMVDNCLYQGTSSCLTCKDGYHTDLYLPLYCSQNGYYRLVDTNYVTEDDGVKLAACLLTYSCKECSLTHPDYLNNDMCVSYGQIYDSGERKQIDIETGALGFSFCRQASNDSSSCVQCEYGYKKSSTDDKVCVKNEVFYAEKCSADANGDCEFCVSDLYLTNKRCCPEMTYYNTDFEKCIAINHNTSFASTTSNDDICVQINKGYCEKCNTGYTLSFGNCCSGTDIFDEGCKAFDVNSGIQLCKQQEVYNGEVVCKQVTTGDDWRLLSCEQPDNTDQYYWTDKHCCALGFMWSSGSCVAITSLLTQPVNANCQMVDENNNCISNDYYLSTDDNLCIEGEYYETSACIPVTINNCLQQLDGYCQKCSTKRSFDNKCCDLQVHQSSNNCADATAIANCFEYEEDPTKCKTCDPFYYLYEDGSCMQYGYYDNDGSPSTIGIAGCIEYNTTDGCVKCLNGYNLSYQNCCKIGQIYHENKGCIDHSFVSHNCSVFNTDQNDKILCQKCKNGKIAENGICCDDGQFFDVQQTNQLYFCRENELMDIRCELYDQSGCQKCKANFSFTKTSNETVNSQTFYVGQCCPLGYTLHEITGGAKQCNYTETDKIPNCIQFDTSFVCEKCQSDYNLLTDNNNKKLCCQDGQFAEDGKCIDLTHFYDNCILFDTSTLKCIICAQNYISSEGFCASLGSYYDEETNQEVESINHEYCKEATVDKCESCKDNSNQYLLNDYCCPLNFHWNVAYKKCVRNSSTYCQKYDDVLKKCLLCSDDSVLYDEKECCQQKTVLFNNKCHRVIENCKEYEDSTTDIKCVQCKTNYYLSFDQKKCCKQNQIIDLSGNCVEKVTFQFVFKNCIKYDFANVKCLDCLPGYYPSLGVCCEFGKIFDTNTRKCTDKTMPDNCNQYNVATSKCQGCEYSYFLTSDKTCKKFENCLEFDDVNDKCKKCFNGYYEHNSHCCQQGYLYETGACVNKLSTEHCLEYDTTSSCKKCLNGYYLVEDESNNKFCCKEEYHCSADKEKTKGQVEFCRQYGSSVNDCVMCQQEFSLMEKLIIFDETTTQIICFPQSIDNCLKSSFKSGTISDNTENILECDTCQNLYQSQEIDNKTLDKSFTHVLVDKCNKYDNSYLFGESSFLCLGCEQGYYLTTNTETQKQTCELRDVSSKAKNCFESNHEFDTDICLECDDKYYLDGGACVAFTIENCLYQTSSADCLYYDYEKYYVKVDYPTPPDTETVITTILRSSITPKIKEATPPYYYKGYIDTCEKNLNCQEEQVQGIPIHLQKYLSCHKCIEEQRIPFVSIFFDFFGKNDDGILRFSMANQNTSKLSNFLLGQENHNSICLKKDLSEFELTGDNNFPQNCAIGVINSVNEASSQHANDESITIDQQSIFCGACQPGYKPLQGTHIFHIYECEEIQNCKIKGDSFNECAECLDKFAFKKQNSFVKTDCVFGGEKAVNCLVFDDGSNSCYACQKNYFLNEDGLCEAITTPHCIEQNNLIEIPIAQQFYDISLMRSFLGCNKCEENFFGVYKLNKKICTERKPYKNHELSPASILKYNCRTYELDDSDQLKCVDCMDDYVLDTSDLCIEMIKNSENCIVAQDNDTCVKCEVPYFAEDKKCKLYHVDNCIQYERDENEDIICVNCATEFLLEEQQCVRGNVDYCEILTSMNTCDKCIEGFQKIQIVDNKDYCMPINQFTNCLEFNQDQMQQNNKLVCIKCEQDFYLDLMIKGEVVCNKFNQVQNCINYVKNPNLIRSSLACQKCQDGYYLQDNFCYQRPFYIDSCATYDKNSQRCLECDLGYYLSEDKLQCVVNPQGTPNCMEYEGEKKCSLCRQEFYLKDEKCIEVPFEYLIPFCLYYESDLQCKICQQGKVLEGNNCVDPLIQNCEEFISIRSCRKCAQGFGIKAVEDRFVCVPKTEKNNCQKQDDLYPFSCQFCKQGYVLIQQNCFLLTPTQTVQNCLYYESPNICLQCEKNYVRSLDKKKCRQIYKENVCQALQEDVESQCALCKQGYFLNEQNQCENYKNLGNIAENCLIYDKMNNMCKLCISGFYQNSKGFCTPN